MFDYRNMAEVACWRRVDSVAPKFRKVKDGFEIDKSMTSDVFSKYVALFVPDIEDVLGSALFVFRELFCWLVLVVIVVRNRKKFS